MGYNTQISEMGEFVRRAKTTYTDCENFNKAARIINNG